MRDPDVLRDISPRIGSPLWLYMASVTAVGLSALVAAVASMPLDGLIRLLGQPLFWVIASLTLLADVRPIMAPGKSQPDSCTASLTFGFAALLYWGFPVAALLRSATTLAAALAGRHAIHRALFNMAQLTLSLGAAGLALSAAGTHPQPLAPWLPEGGRLLAVAFAGLSYFAVNSVLVDVAAALHARSPIPATFRAALPYQAFVNLVLLSAAPLVAVVMGRSVLLVLLFLLPMSAIYASVARSVQREHQAHHDELTGLPNRTMLLRQAADALRQAARTGGRAGFLLLDLDRFKEVNDTLGHHAGDELLRAVARRLTHSIRPGDLVARLGGDEFAVLLPSVPGGSMAREVAMRLRTALAGPIRLEGMSLQVEASVGIALYPDDATAVEVLLQRADVAMYRAKQCRTGVEMYASDADHNSPARLSLLGELRRGLGRGELEVHYLPKVLLAGGWPSGMEALIRWRHPRLGMITSADFMPVAEQSWLARDLTAYVVDAALAQAARWRQDGLPVQVSVNLSARDLLDAGLAGTVERGLREHGLPPGELMLEISETLLADRALLADEALADGPALADGAARGAGTLAPLAALGVPLSLDHFGTGSSSLAGLRRLPVSEIKIDSSFITRLLDGPDNELVVRSLVDLARALGIRSVAEGVDSPGAAAALAAMGCDAAQGPSCSGPLDPAAATAWLADRARPAMIKRRGRGGTHPPGARAAGGRRRPSPAPPASAVDR